MTYPFPVTVQVEGYMSSTGEIYQLCAECLGVEKLFCHAQVIVDGTSYCASHGKAAFRRISGR